TSESQDFWSFEEAAGFGGVRGSILASLLRRTQHLQIRTIEELIAPAGWPCTRFDLSGGWMGQPYGFLYCPANAAKLRRELVHGKWLCPQWVHSPARDYKVIDSDWAYFEMPLSRE